MLNKIFTILIILNFLLFAGRIGISMHLSTRGDDLNRIINQVNSLKGEIDHLESQIVQKSNLENASSYAKNRGFVLSKMVKFTPDSLAHAPQN